MARDLRPPTGPGRWLIAAAVAAFLSPTPHAAPQAAIRYDALVDQYASGDATQAVAAIVGWKDWAASRSDIRSRTMSATRHRAAVMLHTDAAYTLLMSGGFADASGHLGAARRILSAMRGGGDERARTFERRWYAVVAGMYTALGRLDSASQVVRDGFALYPRDPRLYVASGAINEMNATLNAADPRSGNELARNARSFEIAAADYLRALAYDDTLAVAHLHLGWVRFASGDERSVRDFDAALLHADDDRTRYLAHLFRGRVAERKNELDQARRDYEAAMAIGPRYQTAYLALSRVEEAVGHSARARELAHAYAGLSDKREDPWWDYHLGGFDQITLEWLRREARAE